MGFLGSIGIFFIASLFMVIVVPLCALIGTGIWAGIFKIFFRSYPISFFSFFRKTYVPNLYFAFVFIITIFFSFMLLATLGYGDLTINVELLWIFIILCIGILLSPTLYFVARWGYGTMITNGVFSRDFTKSLAKLHTISYIIALPLIWLFFKLLIEIITPFVGWIITNIIL